MAALLSLGAVPALSLALPAAPAAAAQGDPAGPSGITAQYPVDPAGTSLGAISGFSQVGNVVNLTPARGAIRVTFLDAKNFRVEAVPAGAFTDPANSPTADTTANANIIVGADQFTAAAVAVEDGGTLKLKTSALVLEVEKSTGKFTLKRTDGSIVWQESSALTFGATSTTQHLKPKEGEQFLGGGMQNGRSVHTGSTINVARDYDWDDGGNPNAVPYYMTNAGYGVLRNTFAPGSYNFTANESTTHQEARFDAYYFVGDYKQSLDSYTKLTGRPHLPPVYALEYGDADCYNRSNPSYSSSGGSTVSPKQHTFDAVQTAAEFKANDMPAGWMLVNDGYGCEYTPDPVPYDPANPGQGLGGTVKAIKDAADLKTGLWTQRSLVNTPTEVGQDGIAMRKLDVAWVGAGYRMALTSCMSAHDGIEQYSPARGTALMVEGWAGSQRCGMQWTGDHSGNLDAVRWAVSAMAGSGNSGLAFTTSDVDGIFGGSPESYVRDLQWKALSPALYSMSGWAAVDKRPWLYGDAATAINRKYLQLRQELMPYIYSMAVESNKTGLPMMRTMALEFPNDPLSYSAEANTQYMLGSDYLVAPVYQSTDVRNGIVLPAGSQWMDYWSGKVYNGGQVLNGYKAPLETLPMFVKVGSVVPKGIVARNASLVPEDAALTLDVTPSGTSTVVLNEDDKTTREYKNGRSSTQTFTVAAPEKNAGDVTVTIGARQGSYTGMAASRPYNLEVHTGSAPDAVTVGSTTLARTATRAAFDAAATGWFYDAADAGGTVLVKSGQVGATAASSVVLKNASATGGKDSDAAAAEVSVKLGAQVFQGAETTATAVFTNTGAKAKTDVAVAATLPEGWTVKSSTGAAAASVAPGASLAATFVVSPGASSAAGQQTVGAAATYKDSTGGAQSVSGANQLYVAFGSLAGAYNHISVTTVAGKATGNFDGGGASFAAEQLATAATPAGGVRPGSTVTVDAGLPTKVDYTWPSAGPDVKNAVALDGQTIALSGKGTQLAILGAAASGSGVSPELTIKYTDGSVQKSTVFFPNWLQPANKGGATLAVSEAGRNNATGASPEYTQYSYQAFSNSIRLNPTKTIASVTLPTAGNVKFFDWKVVDWPLPTAPATDAFASDLTAMSATTGWGVIGKDVANKDAANSPDVPLSVNFLDPATNKYPTYAKGLGVHAASKITYYLGGQCSRFTADVGLEKGFGGNIIFRVASDGAQKYQSRTFTPQFAPEHIDLDVSGVAYIDLTVDPANAGSINGAHGVWGDAKFTCEPADTTAPVTTAVLSEEEPENGWFTTAPSVTLSATDNKGVAATEYQFDDGEWTEYTEPVELPEGSTVFNYRSSDAAANLESTKTLGEINVDTVVPEVSATVDTAARTVAIDATDEGSGIDSVEYSTDAGSTWNTYTAPIKAGDGGASVAYRATDEAGLVGGSTADAVVAAKETPQPGTPSIDAPTAATPGSTITVALGGLVPGSTVELWLHSEPVLLGAVVVGADGTATITAALPAGLEAGTHTLTVVSGGATLASSALTVAAAVDPGETTPGGGTIGGGTTSGGTTAGGQATTEGGLASTGANVLLPAGLALLLVAAGAVATVVVRRRRA
ncbi:NPCBM/NEW2 domain-containing protein [Arthrobacter sp. 35W]|uniref:NPCBM/NEW2 domain-containing protein n=1 Tax=Arthrobacter sp. 35W TaxID=1132441 RepID=UPI000412EA09|nr:NPCBM/NEW2 domain-containing protein [Arthrobacter sp. 35W]